MELCICHKNIEFKVTALNSHTQNRFFYGNVHKPDMVMLPPSSATVSEQTFVCMIDCRMKNGILFDVTPS